MSSGDVDPRHYRDPVVLGLGCLLAVQWLAFYYYAQLRGIGSQSYGLLNHPGEFFSLDGTYPPGPYWLYWLLRQLWDPGPMVWNAILAALTAGGLAVLAADQGRGPGLVRLSLGLLVLNVYGGWLMLTSNDTVLENLCMVWGLVCYGRFQAARRPGWLLLGATLLLPSLTGLMRVSAWPMWLALLAVDAIQRPAHRRRCGLVLLVTLAIMLAYCAMNLHQHGAFTLSTSTAFNLFLGNNPRYLDVHPQHDIEVLNPLAAADKAAVAADLEAPSPAQLRAAWQARTLARMWAAPTDTLLRLGMKAQWYFLGIAKIPHLTEFGTRLEGNQLQLGTRSALTTVVQLPYGLVFLVLFWGSLLGREQRRRWLAYYAPFMVMGALSLLLFPDTRFRQAAELSLYVPLASWLLHGWFSVRSSLFQREVRRDFPPDSG